MKNELFENDYYRMTGERYSISLRMCKYFLAMHNIRYMYYYRKYQQSKGFLWRLLLYRLSRKYGLEIAVTADIGEGFYLGHPYNITVGGDVKIGKNVNLHKGCTIGRENRGKRAGVPTIGDNVAVGINATIVGNITIGSDVMIAPNSFVNFDVPDHSVVIGNPGVIHYRENATEGYIGFQV